MNQSILKYKNIAYPIFILQKKPFEVIYDNNKIYCRLSKFGELRLVDNKQVSGDYFARLLQVEHRLQFDATCKNLQVLLLSKAKWGVDSNAVSHDFSNKVKVKAEQRKVVKILDNLVWLRNISYPFEISTKEALEYIDDLFATVIKINGEWYIYRFSMESKLKMPYVNI